MSRPPKLDGLGQPLDEHTRYYVQDRRSFCGNAVTWWAIDEQGYVNDIAKAGVYIGAAARALSDRDSDVPWPVHVVLACAATYVDWQRLRDAKPGERAPSALWEGPDESPTLRAGAFSADVVAMGDQGWSFWIYVERNGATVVPVSMPLRTRVLAKLAAQDELDILGAGATAWGRR